MAQHPPANEITKYLSGMHFPAKKSELTEHAKQQGAREEGIRAIPDMPQNSFDTMSPRRAAHCGNALKRPASTVVSRSTTPQRAMSGMLTRSPAPSSTSRILCWKIRDRSTSRSRSGEQDGSRACVAGLLHAASAMSGNALMLNQVTGVGETGQGCPAAKLAQSC